MSVRVKGYQDRDPLVIKKTEITKSIRLITYI